MSIRSTYLNLIEHDSGWEFDVTPMQIPPMMGDGDACLGCFRTDLPMAEVLQFLGSFHESFGERDAHRIFSILRDSPSFEQLPLFNRAA